MIRFFTKFLMQSTNFKKCEDIITYTNTAFKNSEITTNKFVVVISMTY